ncbi:YihY/virulence factor BrkB family protein [Wenxinia saemankumensis]|uniref:Membrane protein n=1 Tax=Wenxinia saemankumensis TaxID=1447782 RepID=A0A1M6AY74_9RHOB|nr:YihY/virulence factor BrkB family protein [Wenxinia saemankumensis]SHI41173.1 membrane protein [Wenxinia saemankumensis]
MERIKDFGGTFLKVWMVADRVHLGLIAAAVAFFGMFSLFPAVAALISIFGLFADPRVVLTQLQLMQELVPGDVYDVLFRQMEALLSARPETLTFSAVLSLSIAMFSARVAIAALMRALNAIYDRPLRGGVRSLLVALGMTASLIGVAFTALTLVVIVPVVIDFLPLPWQAAAVIELSRWLIAISVLIVGLGILYRFGPNRREARPRWITPGALLVILLWLLASTGFSLYLSNFGRYNEVYGSIGAAAAMLMWLYISAYLILLGAAVNVVLERRGLARDHPRPAHLTHPEAGSENAPLG